MDDKDGSTGLDFCFGLRVRKVRRLGGDANGLSIETDDSDDDDSSPR